MGHNNFTRVRLVAPPTNSHWRAFGSLKSNHPIGVRQEVDSRLLPVLGSSEQVPRNLARLRNETRRWGASLWERIGFVCVLRI